MSPIATAIKSGPRGHAGEASRVRIAVFLGDGTAIVSGDRWLIDESGRRSRLVVNPWTAVATFERVAQGHEHGESGVDDVDDGLLEDEAAFDIPGEDQP